MTLDALATCGPYEGALAESIKALKYGGRRSLARPLARELAIVFLRLPSRPDAITWVPMHPKDRAWRGFDHAEILARELSRRVRVPALPLLVKRRRVPPQTNLSPVSRALMVCNAFSITLEAFERAWRDVVLVDDVLCSGCTLREAAKVLKDAGAWRVYGLVLAHSPKHEKIVDAIRRQRPDILKRWK